MTEFRIVGRQIVAAEYVVSAKLFEYIGRSARQT